MGFLTDLFGGSEQSQSSSSGYSTIPKSIRSGFNQLGQGVSQYTNPNDPANLARFTPLAQTGDETNAYNAIRQGFTPTADSLHNDLSMLMNPFNESVIGGINNQAQGNYSILKQALNEAGQFGSNRQTLGANDIELQRQNQIGSLLQNQYNQALGQVFNNLVPQRQQDAQNLLGIGQQQRALDYQTKQAPISALQAGTSMISPFSSSSGSGGGSSQGGILQGVGQLAGGLGLGAMAFSDENLKQDIDLVGKENGLNIYEFSYKIMPERRFRGVMAQEVRKIMPEAIRELFGFLAVDYNKIGIEFREVRYV